jgi:membrane protease subunit (stomatin/prohibitin family)
VSDPDYLLSAMMDELLPLMILKKEANAESRYADQVSIHRKDSYGNQTMTYEEKVKLFNAKRYLMPLRPIGTKNWTIRDYIRFIDQVGRWCPDGKD